SLGTCDDGARLLAASCSRIIRGGPFLPRSSPILFGQKTGRLAKGWSQECPERLDGWCPPLRLSRLIPGIRLPLTETSKCSFAAKIEDETVEAAAIWLQGSEYRIRDRPELVSTKARRNQDDPGV